MITAARDVQSAALGAGGDAAAPRVQLARPAGPRRGGDRGGRRGAAALHSSPADTGRAAEAPSGRVGAGATGPAKLCDMPDAPPRRRPRRPACWARISLVGVATAGYQIEGGFNGDGEPHNNWWGWEPRAGPSARAWPVISGGTRPKHWTGRRLGCNAFRLSVEWARLEPAAGGSIDGRAGPLRRDPLDVQRTRARAHGHAAPLQPSVVAGRGVLAPPGLARQVRAHVQRVLPALAPYCRQWVTINEPNIMMLMGWIQGATARPGAAWPSPTPTACSTTCWRRTSWRSTPSAPSNPGRR